MTRASAPAAEQLDEIAGVGVTSAQELIAELGADMTRFPTAGHLASWAKFAPIDRKSAGQAKGASAGLTGKTITRVSPVGAHPGSGLQVAEDGEHPPVVSV